MEKLSNIWRKPFPVIALFVLVFTLASGTNSYAQGSIQTVSATEAAELIQERPDMVILDIRTAEEFDQGHIKGATNIDFYARDFMLQLMKLDKKATYLLYCRSGNRSAQSLPMFKSQQLQKIFHMNKGMNDWVEAKLPVSKK